MWAEATIAVVSVAPILAGVWVANSYHWPPGLATQYATAHGITEPPGGLQIEAGIPIPLLIVIGVTIVMTFLATRRRFGRDVYAYGGNPDAAELAGINTRWVVMRDVHPDGDPVRDQRRDRVGPPERRHPRPRQGYELYVIAAAVIGGTSFAGGIGTIPGADPRRARHAVAPVRPGLPRRSTRRRSDMVAGGRPRGGRRARRLEPTAGTMMAEARTMTDRQRRRARRRTSGTPLVEMRNINVAFGGVHAVRDVTIDLYPGRGRRPRRRQRRRQVDPDAGPVGRPPGRRGEILINGEPVDDRQPARRQGATGSRRSTRRWPWPTTSTRRPTCSSAAS